MNSVSVLDNDPRRLEIIFMPNVSSSLFCNIVSFPFTEPLVHRIVDHLEAGKAMDFLAKSASKIIAERMMDSDNSTVVSVSRFYPF